MKKAFIALFLIICLVPSLGLVFTGPSGSSANQVLSPAPKPGPDMLKETADYFGDRFAFRNEMVTAWSLINARIFNTSSEKKVVLGNGGELYYANDFTGELSEDKLEAIAAKLLSLQSLAEEKGAEFIFTVAPDKSSLHGENLPAAYREKNTNVKRLEKYLESYGINYISLYDPEIPYYLTDSHWNGYGAAMACDRLTGSDFASGQFVKGGRHKGDLYDMLYPALPDNEFKTEYAEGFSFSCEKDPKDGNAITIKTSNKDGQGKLFCWRDSFGADLYPYLAQEFNEAVFSRSSDYDISKAEGADVIILEIVERNIEELL